MAEGRTNGGKSEQAHVTYTLSYEPVTLSVNLSTWYLSGTEGKPSVHIHPINIHQVPSIIATTCLARPYLCARPSTRERMSETRLPSPQGWDKRSVRIKVSLTKASHCSCPQTKSSQMAASAGNIESAGEETEQGPKKC